MVERLFLAVPGGCLQFMIVVFPEHTHLLFLMCPAQGHNAVMPPVSSQALTTKPLRFL